MKNDIEIKYQAGNLIRSCCRNINENFNSISFTIKINGDIQTKFIFKNYTKEEEQFLEDIIAEFTSMQEKDCVLVPIAAVEKSYPLENLVYSKIVFE